MIGKSSVTKKINYYDALIIMVVSAMVIASKIQYDVDSNYVSIDAVNLSDIFAMITFLLSAILTLLDLKGYDTELMAYGSIFLAGAFIGISHFDLLIMFALLLSLGIRVAKSPELGYFPVFISTAFAITLGFLVGYFFDVFQAPLFASTIIGKYPTVLLILLVAAIVFRAFSNAFDEVYEIEEKCEEQQTRIKELTYINNSLARFVPHQIWQPLIRDNTPASLFNKRAKLTIVFSDIIGFTQLSDNLSPDVLTEILNTYMNRMTIVAKRHDAVLDKFIGDGMMCFFGTHGHRSVEENAVACVEMALDMRREMRDLRRKWQSEGFEGLYVRIGINTGFCHVGNFGTDIRMSYTIIGKEVNLASRLESVAGQDEIVISQSTYDYVNSDYVCEKVGNVKLKGFEEPVTCWRVKEPVNTQAKAAQWVDHELPGFNLHLNFQDIKNYDYMAIRQYLNKAIERVDSAETVANLSIDK
ncbi:MAG: guanylate cyclase [Pseudomonadales bacterium]|nr:MAG: guanylate cyclase [Pseudomonadales bacterium]